MVLALKLFAVLVALGTASVVSSAGCQTAPTTDSDCWRAASVADAAVAARDFANSRWTASIFSAQSKTWSIHLWCGGLGGSGHRRVAVTLDAVPDDAEGARLLDERPRELRAFPITVDDGEHVVVDEGSGAPQIVPFGIGQLVA